MTNEEEALENLKAMEKEMRHGYGNAIVNITLEDICYAISALEKQIPMIPKEETDDRFLHHLYCANCGRYFGISGDLRIPTNSKYCCECGKSIDWGE